MLAQTEIKEQVCSSCKKSLPLSGFYQKAADRLDHTCKECRKQQRRDRYHRSGRTEQVNESFVAEPFFAPVREDYIEPEVRFQNPKDPHPRLPQYTVDEVNRAVKVFEILIRWRNEDRRKGLIDW